MNFKTDGSGMGGGLVFTLVWDCDRTGMDFCGSGMEWDRFGKSSSGLGRTGISAFGSGNEWE